MIWGEMVFIVYFYSIHLKIKLTSIFESVGKNIAYEWLYCLSAKSLSNFTTNALHFPYLASDKIPFIKY